MKKYICLCVDMTGKSQCMKKSKIEYEVVIITAVLLWIRLMRVAPVTIADYPAEQWLITYKYGFIARGFMGSLFSGFIYLAKADIYRIALLFEIVMTLAYLLFVYYLMDAVSYEKKIICGFAVIALTTSPMSPANTYSSNSFGRFDAIMITVVLFQCILMFKPSIFKGIGVILLSVVGILIHPVFVFTYFVVGCALLLYAATKRGNVLTWWILLLLNVLSVCGLFYYFEYIRPIGAGWTQELMYNDMQSRTDFDLGQNFYAYLKDWYFGTVDSQLAQGSRPFPVQPWLLLITVLFLLPYGFIYFWTWVKGYTDSIGGRKFFFFCMLFSFCATIPVFIYELDYGRWCAAYYLVQFIVLLYIFAESNDVANYVFEKTEKWVVNGHRLVAIAAFLYGDTLGWFRDITLLEVTSNGVTFLSKLIETMKISIVGG